MILYTIADVEGDANYLKTILLITKDNPIIFLGDASDKGPGEGEVYQLLREKKALLIAGNRDSNKIRIILELFSPDYLDNALINNLPPYWAPSENNKPRFFYREYLSEQGNTEQYNDISLCTRYHEQSTLEKFWILLEFMHKKTMGAPDRVKFRCQELGVTYQGAHTASTDKQLIVDSFIADMVNNSQYHLLLQTGQVQTTTFPDHFKIGRTWKYLQQSNLIYRLKDTLFCHSGLYVDSYPFLQSGIALSACNEDSLLSPSEKIDYWIHARNTEHQSLLQQAHHLTLHENRYISSSEGLPSSSGHLFADVYNTSLPSAHGLQSNDHTKKTALNTQQAAFFKRAGINTIIHGHQPTCCAIPLMRKENHELLSIATDTAMITGATDGPQCRDGARSTLIIDDSETPSTVLSLGRLNHAAICTLYGPAVDPHDPSVGWFMGDVSDPMIGNTITLLLKTDEAEQPSSHTYKITSRIFNQATDLSQSDYILVCHELQGAFQRVPPGYGIVRISSDRLTAAHEHDVYILNPHQNTLMPMTPNTQHPSCSSFSFLTPALTLNEGTANEDDTPASKGTSCKP